MRAIRKFTLVRITNPVILMPSGAKIVKLTNQTQELVVWAICRDDVPAVSRLTRIYASGQVLPDEPDEYLNTVTVLGKEWHCIEG